MELNVFERLLILNLDTLPNSGNIVTMKIKQKLIADMGFSEDEIKEYGITEKDGNVSWTNVDTYKDIELGPEAVKLLIKAIESSEHVTDALVPLYDRLKEGQ